MDEYRCMNADPNNVLQESVSEVHKRIPYEILDSVTTQLDARFAEFENIFL